MRWMIWAALLSFAAALALGSRMIQALRRLKFGQHVYELAPESHQAKQGTPTMGGLLFAAVTLVAALVLFGGGFFEGTHEMLVLALFAALNMMIGFADDMLKIRSKSNRGGLKEGQKLVAQCAVAALFSAYCYLHPGIGAGVYVPFAGGEWDLGWLYLPVMTFISVCTANGSNLLDGLDGLLASVTAVITAFFAVAALLLAASADTAAWGSLQNIGILCAAACGALLGYLRFNLHPARVIMGDTGSMFLGGLVAGCAMLLRLPLLLPVVAGAYAVSLLSVFLQRMYFKATKGKRIFKMSPLHHHFELCGVPETKIVSMYTIVSVILCLVAFLALRAGDVG